MDKSYILYVDDDFVNLELFKEFLSNDYNVFVESSTSKAEALIEKYPFKVIVSDQRMPEETGLEFLERINQKYPHIIKIIYTAFLDHDAALSAINQGGIFRYLLKPWSSDQMRITLDSAIREFDLKVENTRLYTELQEAFAKLKESEHKFSNIFLSSNDGIIITVDNELVESNKAFLQILDVETQNIDIEVINSFVKRKFKNLFEKPINHSVDHQSSLNEIELVIDGKKKFLELSSKSILYDDKRAVLSIIRDISERKQQEYKIMEAVICTQEQDQNRYAQELHDGLGPILSTLKMYIEWLADGSNTINKEKISNQSIVSINEAISMVKDIANNLSPHVLQRFGLVNALQTYAERINQALGIELVISSNLTTRLPDNIEIHIYRILLECINNSLKHAEPKKILIKFKKAAEGFTIHYSDNGKGFNLVEVAQNGKGMGLYNIQNRVALLSGTLKINSNIGVGTDIDITLTI